MNPRHIAKFLLVSASFLALEMSVARADEMVRTKIGGTQIAARIAQPQPNGPAGDCLKSQKSF